MIELMEETANMLRGMCMDPRIPKYAKEALWSRISKLDAATEAAADDEAGEPVSPAYELKPAAWIAGNGHPHHLNHIQGVRERQLYGPLRPLYDEQTLWNACARAEGIGRDQIKARLLELHEAHKHQHNHFAWAVQELFVARRFSGRVA